SYYILALGLSTSSSSCIFFFFFYCSAAHRYSHSFPTRRSSDLFVWWKETYGDDFYVELNRHGIPEEDVVNETLLKFAEKHNVKRSEEHTSELQSRENLVCRLLLEKKKTEVK